MAISSILKGMNSTTGGAATTQASGDYTIQKMYTSEELSNFSNSETRLKQLILKLKE